MGPREFLKELEKGSVRPVYLFTGSERHTLEETLKKAEKVLVDPASKAFNFDVFECPQATAETIVTAARTLPMMSGRRVVLAKDIDKLSASELEILGKYIKDPSPSTCVILLADKPDMRKGFFVGAKEIMVEFNPLSEGQVPAWLRAEAEGIGKRISEEATEYLVEAVGNDLVRLRNELEKASLFAGEKKEISLDDVEAVSRRSKMKSIFDLTDAIGARDAGKAVRILDDLLKNGESGIYVLFMVARQLRQIWKVKSLMDKGMSSQSAGKELKIPPFLQKKITDQARRFTTKNLREVFDMLLDADTSLKSGRLTERLVLENLFLNLQGQVRKREAC